MQSKQAESAKHPRWPVASVLVLVLVALSSTGCAKTESGQSPKAAEPTSRLAVSPAIATPQRITLQTVVRQPGAIQAYEQTPMFSKIAGYVQKWHVDIGDRVQKGALLAELWVPEMEVDLKQKEALIQQSDAEVKQSRETAIAAEAGLKSAEAKIKEAQAGRSRVLADNKRTKSQYDRLTRVGQSGVLDKEAVEETRYAYEASMASLEEVEAKVKSAEAARDESAAKLSKARAEILVAEAHLQVAKENRNQVRVMLEYAKLRAPFDGVISRRTADTGHFVQPATGTRAEPLYVVERRDLLRIFVEVPEADAGWIARGNFAAIRVPALRGQEFTGKVARTSYSLDRTSRTLVAEIDMTNPKDRLRPGMYVLVTISGQHPNVLAVPTSAIMTQGDVTQGYQTYCFLIQDGKAIQTPVEIGRGNAQFTEVLRFKRPGAKTEWETFTGNEAIAVPAASVSNGSSIMAK